MAIKNSIKATASGYAAIMKVLRRTVVMVALALSLAVSASGQSVYASKAGRKYHASRDCWSLQRSKTVEGMSLEDARKRGLEPCKVCYRPKKGGDDVMKSR